MPVISGAVALGLLVGFTLVLVQPGPAPVSAAGVAGAAPAPGPMSFEIELGEMYVKPASIDVPAGADVTVHVTNRGTQQHTLALEGRETPLIDPGKSATIRWGVLTRSTEAWCLVAGHKDSGMRMTITIAGQTLAAGAAPDAAPTAGTEGTAAASTDAKIDPSAKPGPGWQAMDPTLKPAEGGATHEVTFHIQEKVMEVAPGVKQMRWTFAGTAPGPTLHGKVGDVFKVTLVNDGTMEHSIDFHASKVAPNVQMRTIKPNESLVYEFKASYAGIFTYHCGADPMIYHMGNGMVGAVVVDPPDLGKVDKEIVLVQSELSLGPAGQPGDLKKMLAGASDAVVFNGYFNQYAYTPITVNPGDRVRAWVLDAGPNENTAFHVVGTIFDTVWKEGAYLLQPNNPNKGGSQTLDLQPTQGGFVEFTLPDAGTYPFITHKMMNMAKGALGVFQVGETK
ncbi:multicopper oxidase domain-containing protein [Nonomuraea sp. NPDC048916]|uniref:multicopper oxidase domain-containing protein n=1 Tax=Nonomuraea sp. NPDC048916 TaxID=3154232 RepID=UPI0033D590DB